MKRKLVVFLSAAMIAGSLSGCSLPFGEKVTAEGLIENAFGTEKVTSVDMGLSLDLDAEMDLSEFGEDVEGTMEMSIGLDANMIKNEDYAHLDGDIKLNMLGMNVNEKMERYYDYGDELQYDYDSDSETWTYAEIEDEEAGNLDMDFSADIFKDLTLTEHKKGDDYVVTATIDFSELENIMGEDVVDMGDFSESIDMEDITMDVTMAFAEDTKLIKSLKLGVDIDEVDGMAINDFAIEVVFNQIGGEIDVKIPKSVKKNAVDASTLLDPGFSVEGPEVIPNNTPQPSVPVVEPNVDEKTPVNPPVESDVVTPNTGDVLGSYNGVTFTGATPLSIFTDDGWTYDGFSGIFASYENDKYDESVLYLYGLKDKISPDDLNESGVYGYECDITYNETGVYPKMTFNGLTWGATEEDIVAVYGETPNVYEAASGGYKTLTYSADDGTEMTFYVYTNNEFGIDGLTRVSVVNYEIMD